PASVSLAALLVTRLLDLATLALSMGIACLVLAANGSSTAWFPALGAALCAVSVLLFLLCMRGDVLVRAGAWISRTAALKSFAVRIDGLASALREAGAQGRLARAVPVSLATWACVFLFCAVLARGLGLGEEIGLAGATFGS